MDRILVCDYNSSDVWVLSADDLSLVDTLTFPDGYPAVIVGDSTGHYVVYFKTSAVPNLFKYDLDLNFLWSATLGAGVSPVSSIFNPSICQDDDNVYVYVTWKNGISIIARKIYKISKSDGSITQDVATYNGYLCDSLMIYGGDLYHFVGTGVSRWLKLSTADLSFISEQDVTVWPYTHAAYYASDGLVFFGVGQADADFWKFDPSDHLVLQIYSAEINVNDPTYDYLSFCQVTGGKVIVMQQRDPYVAPVIEIAAYDIATGSQVVKTTVGTYGWWIGLAVGLPDPLTPSFEESRDRLEGRGYITLYIDELTEAMEIFETINEAVGSYLYSGYDGKYRYKIFEIEPGESVMQFADDEIFSFSEKLDATEVFSNVRAEYAYRKLQDFPQVYLYEKKECQYLQNSPIPVSMEKRLPFSQRPDAIFWAQRALQMYGERRILYDARVSAKGWTLLPGGFSQITYSRRNINAVLEILEVKRDLKRLTVDLVLGDQHGMIGGGGGGVPGGGTTVDPGFWMDDAPIIPTRFSEYAGYGTGDAENWNKDWATEIKAWARQNMGFWCDENGYADPTDPDSRLPSTWV